MEISSVDCPKCGGMISEQVRHGKLFKCSNCGSTLVWPDSQSKLVLSFGLRLCPDCGIDNEQIRNYCRNCAAALTKTCCVCEKAFYVGDTFCPNGHNYDNELQQKEKRMQKQREYQKEEAKSILARANAAYDKGKNLELVLVLCEDALLLVPDLAEAFFLRGMVNEDFREWDDAINDYQNALKYDPSLKKEITVAIHEIETKKRK